MRVQPRHAKFQRLAKTVMFPKVFMFSISHSAAFLL